MQASPQHAAAQQGHFVAVGSPPPGRMRTNRRGGSVDRREARSRGRGDDGNDYCRWDSWGAACKAAGPADEALPELSTPGAQKLHRQVWPAAGSTCTAHFASRSTPLLTLPNRTRPSAPRP